MAAIPQTLDDEAFRAIVAVRAGPLLHLVDQLRQATAQAIEPGLTLLTRPFLGVVLSQASQLEELLDAYGALNNARWHNFRSVVAALKLFARAHYAFLHLVHAVPFYRLPPVDADLPGALLQARQFTARVLRTAGQHLTHQADALHLPPEPVDVCAELLPPGQLPQDRVLRHVDDVGETVAHLATAFLNLAEASTPIEEALRQQPAGQSDPPLPDEVTLRNLTEDFHNLQALYDTRVSNTDAEQADPDLRSLRGHASVVFHLLETATDLAHYYERHVAHNPAGPDTLHLFVPQPGCVGPECLQRVLRHCILGPAAAFLSTGRTLAQEVLRRYAVPDEVTVPVPRYRGFHVRPSTLVARIVRHYGSPVSLTLEGETYDPSSPLELFRANERINAHKRRWLAREIARLVDPSSAQLEADLIRAVRYVLLRLAEQAKVILYEQPLPDVEGPPDPDQPPLSFVVEAITRLQALGKIDIATPLTACFHGDRRVLADLKCLAEYGYGEDAYGNNIALPAQLAYLRR